jgi:hypothetical protein
MFSSTWTALGNDRSDDPRAFHFDRFIRARIEITPHALTLATTARPSTARREVVLRFRIEHRSGRFAPHGFRRFERTGGFAPVACVAAFSARGTIKLWGPSL